MAGRRPTLVEEVREQLLELISDGSYEVGDRLPNEQDMSDQFAVSRATVREALRVLIDMGYLLRKHGTGTFVARTPQRLALDLNLSYKEMIQAAGCVPSVRVLSRGVVMADEYTQQRLRVDETDEVVVFERVRFADGKPVVFSVDRIPVRAIPEELRQAMIPSLYDLLEEMRRGARNGRTRITPVVAGEWEGGYLEVATGTPLLHFDEVDYDEAGMPVMASLEWHTGDVFELWINRRRTRR